MKGKGMNFNVLIKRDEGLFLAHCLELDIVTTAPTVDQVKADIYDLILAQVEYAFGNDNLDNLYHPAQREVWEEFFACKERARPEIIKLPAPSKKKGSVIPPEIVASTCLDLGAFRVA